MSLDLLASRLGIATSYTGARGEQIAVPESTVIGIVASMGHDTRAGDWVTRALASLDATTSSPAPEPVLVAWDGMLAEHERPADGALVAEDGTDLTAAWRAGEALPYGYHQLVTAHGTSLVVSTPVRLPGSTRRRVCVFAPLYALRPADPTRFADLRELDELVTWAADCGADAVLTLPLLAGFFDEPVEHSPYAPASRWMWNELYAVVDRPPLDGTGDIVDYTAAYAATVVGIDAEVRRLDDDPFAAGAFLQFLAARPEVGAYARFRAAGERHGRDWRRWPEALRHGVVPVDAVDAGRVRWHAVAQWLVHTQLDELAARARARDVALGLDLAVGTHALAFDVWVDQASYATGASVGAPPDAFFPGGQVWGFPPPLPEAARRSGYRQLRAALRHHLQLASLLRIDHVMGLLRLYWVPDGAPAADGTYVFAPLDEQLAVVCLEAWRAGATIVGENLGLVPDEIDAAMTAHGLLGMTVAYTALENPTTAVAPLTAPATDVATFGTHDMATFTGFVTERDLDDRIALGLGGPAEAEADRTRRRAALAAAAAARGRRVDEPAFYDTLAGELAASDAAWLVIALDDLFDDPAPHNVPGTRDERPNWLRRARHPLASAPARATDRLRRIARARTSSFSPKTTASPKGQPT